jgi:eukaryotic-like serine/threonine-protein kinase
MPKRPPSLDPALPNIGELVGRYLITGVVGTGGMGVVYSAEETPSGRAVALKVVHPDHARREKTRARFLREAKVASALRHQGAVEIYDFGAHGETLFMAMEILEGSSLRSIVDASEGHDSGRLTKDGIVSGTPDYMSPEQVRGMACTPASDVYALGLILYEMLTSKSPLSKPNPAITLTRQLFTMPTPMREAFPALDIPEALDALVLAMVAKAAPDRPSAEEVEAALVAIAKSA